jgi:DNA-binding FrmR family transcriptional regulator
VFLKINGRIHYLWRAVDQDGEVLDILVQSRRDKKAAKKFFRKLLKDQRHRGLGESNFEMNFNEFARRLRMTLGAYQREGDMNEGFLAPQTIGGRSGSTMARKGKKKEIYQAQYLKSTNGIQLM